MCIKKGNLKNPQWLRDVKSKKYSIFRIDTLFSNKKYRNIKFINNGGWHFSYLKDAKGVEEKLKSNDAKMHLGGNGSAKYRKQNIWRVCLAATDAPNKIFRPNLIKIVDSLRSKNKKKLKKTNARRNILQ